MTRPFQLCGLPRALLIVWLGKNLPNEYLPRVTMIRGAIISICSSRYGPQDCISLGSGSLLLGARHLIMFVM